MKNRTVKTSGVALLAGILMMLGLSFSAFAHCQIPCGIYDDHARVDQMLEDSATVIKAAKLITELAGMKDPQSINQSVRWVMNKEKHAQKVISTICDYFLTQRVKESQKDYVERLKAHHAVIVAAMKAKQSADVSAGIALQKTIEVLEKYYPAK
jgi:nickel superoxide dismutase